jgi:hypothetical protein
MKNTIAAIVIMMALSEVSYSQNVNWRSLRDNRPNVVQFNLGYDYGVTTQVGYSRSFMMFKPAMVGLDVSFPMGGDLLDDFKVRLGGQIEVIEINGFSATIKISSVFRRYHTELVSISSFGSDFGVVAGYYTQTFFLGGEFGFDKAITSRMKHSDIMRTNFPAIKDGWYVPTGGHYYYGIQGGKTLGENLDLSLRLGATKAQFHDEDTVLPLYLQLGLGMRL